MAMYIYNPVRVLINDAFRGRDAFSVVGCTLTTVAALYLIHRLGKRLSRQGLIAFFQLLFISAIKKVPGGQKIIDSELKKLRNDLKQALKPSSSKHPVHHHLPDRGVERQVIREELKFQLSLESKVQYDRMSSSVNSKHFFFL